MPRITQKGIDSALDSVDLLEEAKTFLSESADLPPICDFIEHPSFLGHKLFPRQKALMKLFFLETENMTDYEKNVINEWANNFSFEGLTLGISPDVWERVEWLKANGYAHFREILNITGRRGGKGYLGGLIGAYQSWKMIKLGSPQEHFGFDRDKELYLYVAATNIEQAASQQFSDIANVIVGAECFRRYIDDAGERAIYLKTPADMKKLAVLEAANVRVNRRLASVRIMPVSTNPAGRRGAACYGLMFDEFAHIIKRGPNVGDELYSALVPSLDQFRKEGMIYIPTNPYTQVGPCYQLYQSALEGAQEKEPLYPNMLVVQLASWDPYEDWEDAEKHGSSYSFDTAPQIYDKEMELLQKRDPDKFSMERLSQWSTVMDAYLDAKKVDDMFKPFWDGHEMRETSKIETGPLNKIFRSHIDPSFTGANTAMSIAHAEKVDDGEGDFWYHVFLDYSQVWHAQDFEGHSIDYVQVEDELMEIYHRFPTLSHVTLDQYGVLLIPRLRERFRAIHKNTMVGQENFNAASNEKRYERFKAALNMGWIHAYPDTWGPNGSCLLEQELKFLQKLSNGRVDRQKSGPIQTKDYSDTFVVLVDQLLEDNFQKLLTRRKLGETHITPGAPQGYHTTKGDIPQNRSTKDKLRSYYSAGAGPGIYETFGNRSRGSRRRGY